MTKADLNNNNSFKRDERLKSKKIITSLFDRKEGSFFVCKPLTIAYKIVDENCFQLPQIGFTVSKSKFKLAVDRNLIKRRMRSAYRTNNNVFLNKLKEENKSLALMFIYNKNTLVKFSEIDKAIATLLKKLFLRISIGPLS